MAVNNVTTNAQMAYASVSASLKTQAPGKKDEKVAEKPTTQNIVYPQAGSTANVGCDLKDTEFNVLPVNADQPAALENKSYQSAYGREEYTEADAD